MASEIRVDKINSLSGVGTVTLSPTGVDIAGITTAATLRATTGIVTSLTAGSLTSLGAVSGTTGTFSSDVSVAGDFQVPDVIKHEGDVDTKIRFPAADTVTVETGGVERLSVTSAGIGVTGRLSVHHSLVDTEGEFLRIGRTDLPLIRYHSIKAKHGGATVNNYISFLLHDISDVTSQSEVLRLRGDGKVGVGTSVPTAKIDVVDDSASGYVAEFRQSNTSNSAQILIDSPTNADSRPVLMEFSRAGTLQWSIGQGYNSSGGAFHLATSSLSAGVTGVKASFLAGGGLTFNGDTAAANALDDYEEGTWTPGVGGSSGSVTSYYNQEGGYTKIGRFVKCHFRVRVNDAGNAAGNIEITNLPFTVADTLPSTGLDGSGGPTYWAGQSAAIVHMTIVPQGNTTKAWVYIATGAQTVMSNLTNSNAFGGGWDVRAELMYFAA